MVSKIFGARLYAHGLMFFFIPVLPIMVTVMVSKWVGDGFGKEGIYDAIIHLNGYPFLDTKAEYIYNSTARDVMTKFEDLDLLTVSGHTVESLGEIFGCGEFFWKVWTDLC